MSAARSRPRRTSPLKLTDAFDLFTPSKDLIIKNSRIFLPLYILPFIFSAHAWIWTPSPDAKQGKLWTDYSWFGSGFSSSSLPSYLWYALIGFSILWLLFVIVAGTIFQIMTQEAQLEAAQGGRVSNFSKLWAVVKELGWRMVGLYALVALYVIGGLILFIVPGLIMLRRYFLSPYVMLDTRCGIREAMDRSAAMSKPYPWAVWGVIGVMFLIGLINVVPFIGWLAAFILGMFYSVAPALRYQELKKLTSD